MATGLLKTASGPLSTVHVKLGQTSRSPIAGHP